jgi:hypothetical protein
MTCGPGPPCWTRRSRKGVPPWCSCMPPEWQSAFSPAGLGESGGVLVTARQLRAPRAALWLLLSWASLHDAGPRPRVVGGGPWSVLVKTQSATAEDASEESHLLKRGRPPRMAAMPSHSPHALRPSTFRAPGWGAPALLSPCCCWRSATLRKLVPFSHRSTSRIFIKQPGCIPSSMVTQDGDHKFDWGEKQAGLRPQPRPQLQGSSSSLLGWRAS